MNKITYLILNTRKIIITIKNKYVGAHGHYKNIQSENACNKILKTNLRNNL